MKFERGTKMEGLGRQAGYLTYIIPPHGLSIVTDRFEAARAETPTETEYQALHDEILGMFRILCF